MYFKSNDFQSNPWEKEKWAEKLQNEWNENLRKQPVLTTFSRLPALKNKKERKLNAKFKTKKGFEDFLHK